MCRPLIFIVLQVLALKCVPSYSYKDYILAYIPIEELSYFSPENIDALPLSYYNNALFYDPWYYQNMMMQNDRSSYQLTNGPMSFEGRVKAKGAVAIRGNDGYGTFTSYSAPPTPLTITSQPALPTISSLLADTTLPTITTLPAVTLPPTTISHTFIDTVPSTVSVPTTPLPYIVVTTTVPNDVGLNGNVASPVKFSGMVPASGRVKISAHFC